MKNKPLVSIIIPTYNRSSSIIESLKSILLQDYLFWECIIVDDGSIDDTEEIVNKFIKNDQRFLFTHRPSSKKKGANACRNHGANLAKGPYMIFLDSDDYLIDNCLSNRVKSFLNNQTLDFLVFGMLRSDTRELVNKDPIEKNRENYLKMFLSHNLPWTITSPIWKKDSFKKIGGFDENLLRFQDVELHIRALLSDKIKFLRIETNDCVYTLDSLTTKKYNQDVFLKLLLDNFILLNFKILNLLEKTKIMYKLEFKHSFYKIIDNYTYNNNKTYKKERKDLFKLAQLNTIFSRKEVFILKIISTQFFRKLTKVKGLGFYRLKKKIEIIFSLKTI